MRRLRQAVVLAGGRGRRLAPLTDQCPKPMLAFHGRPFLAYLIELLRDAGLERVLLLLGYLPEAIEAYFGDGHRVGIDIEYSVTAVEDETGRRLAQAAARLDPAFLLLYCDNYWPLRLDAMWTAFQGSGATGQLTVYENADGYSRDNVLVDAEGWITSYDRSRRAPGLRGVDIGFALLRREALDLLPDGNVSFEATVYPRLVERRQMRAFRTGHRYYSIGSPERLAATEEFLARRPAIIIDRDGVLNRKPPRAEYVRSWEDFEWLPGALEALRLLTEAGYRLLVVSNQAGIARGQLTHEALAAIHERMRAEAAASGGRLDAIYVCPHGWDEGCACRKPKPGMLWQAQREFALDLSRTVFVGDDERDGQASEAAGCRWEPVMPERSLLDVARQLLGAAAEARA